VVTTCSNRIAVPVLCTLPVELLEFYAVSKGQNVNLYWSTASEKNNSYFEVERSADGIHFSAIGRVNGAMNSSEVNRYELDDTQPLQGINYYRLVQYDVDGASHYSKIIILNRTNSAEELFTVAPNPTADYFTVFFPTDYIHTTITIIDAVGKVVYTAKVPSATNSLQVGESLAKGAYIIHVTTSDLSASKLVLKE
jgi:hypothetical protein